MDRCPAGAGRAQRGPLCALPALLAGGLLEGVERHLQRSKGY